MQITGNQQMARIVCHNDKSVREGYIRNGGKEIKLFTSALKAFQCNNRIVSPRGSQSESMFTVPCIQSESNLSALSQAKKLIKLTTQMKNISHASRIPSLNQSPTCHSAEWEKTTFAKPSIIDSYDMRLRTVYSADAQKKTPIQPHSYGTKKAFG
ncbi:transposable element Tcb1 transposase [Trichonephila clavipes]|nr:transposable element Tcb1 transposase [Trichonephila clavipes]